MDAGAAAIAGIGPPDDDDVAIRQHRHRGFVLVAGREAVHGRLGRGQVGPVGREHAHLDRIAVAVAGRGAAGMAEPDRHHVAAGERRKMGLLLVALGLGIDAELAARRLARTVEDPSRDAVAAAVGSPAAPGGEDPAILQRRQFQLVARGVGMLLDLDLAALGGAVRGEGPELQVVVQVAHGEAAVLQRGDILHGRAALAEFVDLELAGNRVAVGIEQPPEDAPVIAAGIVLAIGIPDRDQVAVRQLRQPGAALLARGIGIDVELRPGRHRRLGHGVDGDGDPSGRSGDAAAVGNLDRQVGAAALGIAVARPGEVAQERLHRRLGRPRAQLDAEIAAEGAVGGDRGEGRAAEGEGRAVAADADLPGAAALVIDRDAVAVAIGPVGQVIGREAVGHRHRAARQPCRSHRGEHGIRREEDRVRRFRVAQRDPGGNLVDAQLRRQHVVHLDQRGGPGNLDAPRRRQPQRHQPGAEIARRRRIEPVGQRLDQRLDGRRVGIAVQRDLDPLCRRGRGRRRTGHPRAAGIRTGPFQRQATAAGILEIGHADIVEARAQRHRRGDLDRTVDPVIVDDLRAVDGQLRSVVAAQVEGVVPGSLDEDRAVRRDGEIVAGSAGIAGARIADRGNRLDMVRRGAEIDIRQHRDRLPDIEMPHHEGPVARLARHRGQLADLRALVADAAARDRDLPCPGAGVGHRKRLARQRGGQRGRQHPAAEIRRPAGIEGDGRIDKLRRGLHGGGGEMLARELGHLRRGRAGHRHRVIRRVAEDPLVHGIAGHVRPLFGAAVVAVPGDHEIIAVERQQRRALRGVPACAGRQADGFLAVDAQPVRAVALDVDRAVLRVAALVVVVVPADDEAAPRQRRDGGLLLGALGVAVDHEGRVQRIARRIVAPRHDRPAAAVVAGLGLPDRGEAPMRPARSGQRRHLHAALVVAARGIQPDLGEGLDPGGIEAARHRGIARSVDVLALVAQHEAAIRRRRERRIVLVARRGAAQPGLGHHLRDRRAAGRQRQDLAVDPVIRAVLAAGGPGRGDIAVRQRRQRGRPLVVGGIVVELELGDRLGARSVEARHHHMREAAVTCSDLVAAPGHGEAAAPGGDRGLELAACRGIVDQDIPRAQRAVGIVDRGTDVLGAAAGGIVGIDRDPAAIGEACHGRIVLVVRRKAVDLGAARHRPFGIGFGRDREAAAFLPGPPGAVGQAGGEGDRGEDRVGRVGIAERLEQRFNGFGPRRGIEGHGDRVLVSRERADRDAPVADGAARDADLARTAALVDHADAVLRQRFAVEVEIGQVERENQLPAVETRAVRDRHADQSVRVDRGQPGIDRGFLQRARGEARHLGPAVDGEAVRRAEHGLHDRKAGAVALARGTRGNPGRDEAAALRERPGRKRRLALGDRGRKQVQLLRAVDPAAICAEKLHHGIAVDVDRVSVGDAVGLVIGDGEAAIGQRRDLGLVLGVVDLVGRQEGIALRGARGVEHLRVDARIRAVAAAGPGDGPAAVGQLRDRRVADRAARRHRGAGDLAPGPVMELQHDLVRRGVAEGRAEAAARAHGDGGLGLVASRGSGVDRDVGGIETAARDVEAPRIDPARAAVLAFRAPDDGKAVFRRRDGRGGLVPCCRGIDRLRRAEGLRGAVEDLHRDPAAIAVARAAILPDHREAARRQRRHVGQRLVPCGRVVDLDHRAELRPAGGVALREDGHAAAVMGGVLPDRHPAAVREHRHLGPCLVARRLEGHGRVVRQALQRHVILAQHRDPLAQPVHRRAVGEFQPHPHVERGRRIAGGVRDGQRRQDGIQRGLVRRSVEGDLQPAARLRDGADRGSAEAQLAAGKPELPGAVALGDHAEGELVRPVLRQARRERIARIGRDRAVHRQDRTVERGAAGKVHARHPVGIERHETCIQVRLGHAAAQVPALELQHARLVGPVDPVQDAVAVAVLASVRLPGDGEAAVGKGRDRRRRLVAGALQVDLEIAVAAAAIGIVDLREDIAVLLAARPVVIPGDDEAAARQRRDDRAVLVAAGVAVDDELCPDGRTGRVVHLAVDAPAGAVLVQRMPDDDMSPCGQGRDLAVFLPVGGRGIHQVFARRIGRAVRREAPRIDAGLRPVALGAGGAGAVDEDDVAVLHLRRADLGLVRRHRLVDLEQAGGGARRIEDLGMDIAQARLPGDDPAAVLQRGDMGDRFRVGAEIGLGQVHRRLRRAVRGIAPHQHVAVFRPRGGPVGIPHDDEAAIGQPCRLGLELVRRRALVDQEFRPDPPAIRGIALAVDAVARSVGAALVGPDDDIAGLRHARVQRAPGAPRPFEQRGDGRIGLVAREGGVGHPHQRRLGQQVGFRRDLDGERHRRRGDARGFLKRD